MNEFEKIFRNVRSVRKYECTEISRETVKRILELATQAPSGLNNQPWLYCVVENAKLKKKIRDECERVETQFYEELEGKNRDMFSSMGLRIKKPFLMEAPGLVCVFAVRDAPYFGESAWISIGWIMLAAQTFSLCTLTYTPHSINFLNSLLDVPENFIPQVILPLGRGKITGEKKRKGIDEVSRYYE